jgi:hypothetical protein
MLESHRENDGTSTSHDLALLAAIAKHAPYRFTTKHTKSTKARLCLGVLVLFVVKLSVRGPPQGGWVESAGGPGGGAGSGHRGDGLERASVGMGNSRLFILVK